MVPPFRRALACALALSVPFAAARAAAAGAAAASAPAAVPARHAAAAPARATFDFVDADIDAVARAMAAVLGRPIAVDPRVKGKLTLATDDAVTPARAWLLFTGALRGLGDAVVENNGVLEIVPEADAKLLAGTVLTTGGVAARQGDPVMTQVIRLSYENATNLVASLRPLITANNTITVNPGNNSLVITDYASNLARLGAIVAALDTPSATDVEVMPLQYARASDIAATVQKLTEGAAATPAAGGNGAAAAAGAGNGGATSVMADPHLDALLVRAASPARLAAIRALVARLDRPGASGAGTGNVHVIYLQHADASRLASVLRAALPSAEAIQGGAAGAATAVAGNPATAATSTAANASPAASTGTGSAGASASTTTPLTATAAPSLGGYIQADPASNALVVTASEAVFRDIRAVVDELDVRRAQVYVESLVVEVDASRALDVGLQWKQLFNISSTTELTLGTVATALETLAGTNILSTANLVTLDNEEAKIVVGQNVPFVTGSYTTSASTSTTNPFQTIERKDVGVTLRIRPQIGRNGAIRMAILQESSSVASTSATEGPTTNTRSIESTVVVDDGKIIVLGGLIEDSDVGEADNLPVVSRLPWVGPLFRSLTHTRKKTNLLVFLRPVVMPDAAAGDALTLDRYDQIRARQVALPADTSAILEHAPVPALPSPAAARPRAAFFTPVQEGEPAAATGPAAGTSAPAPASASAPGSVPAPSPMPAP